MLITIVGDGLSAEVLAHAAEHAGHTVVWTRGDNVAAAANDADIVILAGRGVARADADAVVGVVTTSGGVVVDAADPPLLSNPPRKARVVRAFASVPPEAFAAAADGSAPADLGVPLAGDDPDAKAVVVRLMHAIGVEPFDLGSLGAGDVIEPGGALWGRALTPVELLEQVGELSGDG